MAVCDLGLHNVISRLKQVDDFVQRQLEVSLVLGLTTYFKRSTNRDRSTSICIVF